MDDKVIIALATLSGAIVTGIISLIGKWIDKRQRLAEHQMTLRSIYVGKKIEASQNYIGKNNIRINQLYLNNQYFQHVLTSKESIAEVYAKTDIYQQTVDEVNLSKDAFVSLYFDITSYTERLNTLTDEANNILIDISDTIQIPEKGKFNLTVSQETKIRNLLSANAKLIDEYKSLNKYIRDSLSVYDLI